MSPAITIAGNLHTAAVEAAYGRMIHGTARFSGFESEEEDSRLRQLSRTFSLSALEQNLLLFAAAREVAPAIPDARMLLEAGSSLSPGLPTVQASYELFGGTADWLSFRNALREDSPLRQWQLLTVSDPGEPLPARSLSADPRIVDFLLGDELAAAGVSKVARWRGVTRSAQPLRRDAAMDRVLAQALLNLEAFVREPAGRRLFFVLAGGSPDELEEFAQAVVRSLETPLLAMNAGISESDRTLVLRESLLARASLLVHDLPPAIESAEASGWYEWLAKAAPITFLARRTEDGCAPVARPALLQGHAWVNLALPPSQAPMEHKLGELAQHIPATAAWSDLVLPPEIKSRLEDLCRQARFQRTVLGEGGFGRKLSRGRGVTGLFCGPSGTGKTMAAEVIAHRLDRELYRVDLARIVSKYIGETEKSLRRIFAEAERARCVLFFDEADALFGKRAEIRSGQDRWANLEVSYLLQLFEEAEHAVVLLASNRRQSIDEAFARRFRFVVDFPMPNAALRRELWQNSFSAEIPLDAGVRVDVLADRLPLSGASIRNIALASAFLAVEENNGAPGPVSAVHIVSAARRELEKLSSPMPITVLEMSAPLPKRAAR